MKSSLTVLANSHEGLEGTVPYSGSRSSIDRSLTSVDLRLYILERLSRKGSKSDTYLAKWEFQDGAAEEVTQAFHDQEDKLVVIKLPKKIPGIQDISQKNRLARIAYMQTVEAHTSRKVLDLGRQIARVLYSETFACIINGRSARLPVILQERVSGATLQEFVTKRYRDGDKTYHGIRDRREFITLIRAITRLIQKVHRAQVVHGDISSNNLMIRDSIQTHGRLEPADVENALCIIDFGEAAFRDELGLGDMGSLGMLYERLEKVTEAYDIRQLGLLFAFLAGGETRQLDHGVRHLTNPIERRDRVSEFLLRNNPGLLREAAGITEVIAACLSPDVDARPRSAADVLAMLNIFVEDMDSASLLTTPQADAGRTSQRNISNILDGIVAITRMRLESQEADLDADVQHVYGRRDEIEMGLCSVLSRLGDRDEYWTLSHPGFWSDDNLTIRGRFFTLNRVALARGANIRRIFVVSDADLEKNSHIDKLVRLLSAHAELAADFNDRRNGALYQVKVLPVTEDYRRRLIVDGNNFGLLRVAKSRSEGTKETRREYITATLRYHGERIVGVTFIRGHEMGKEFEKRFRYFNAEVRAVSLQQYLVNLISARKIAHGVTFAD